MTVVVLLLAGVFAVIANVGGSSSGRRSGTMLEDDRDTEEIVLYGAPAD